MKKGYSFEGLVNKVNEVDASAVHKAGDETVAGTKTFSDCPATTAAQGASNNHLAKKSYVDEEAAKKANLSGATYTGNITAPAVLMSAAQNTGANAATRKDYVDAEDAKKISKTGDAMTGRLRFPMLASMPASDLNTVGDDSGFSFNYSHYTAIGKPPGEDHALLTQSWGDKYQTQLAGDWRTNKWYVRTQDAGNWLNWAEIYTTVSKPTAIDVGAARAIGGIFSGPAGNITTAQFVQWLTDSGAFNDRVWIARGQWSYAINKTITDTGCGNIHLSGCTIEVISQDIGTYTVRIITPTTTSGGGTTGAEFVYVNNGDEYTPGWRRIYTTAWKPTAADVGLGNVPNITHTVDAIPDTVPVRDSAGDINVRLLKANYPNEGNIGGAIAFRNNNTNDNSTRYCNNPNAVRNWLGAAPTIHNHTPVEVGASPVGHTHTAAEIGAAPTIHKHTPVEVGLGSVNNWPATPAINDPSNTKYATAGAVKVAYDLASSKLSNTDKVFTTLSDAQFALGVVHTNNTHLPMFISALLTASHDSPTATIYIDGKMIARCSANTSTLGVQSCSAIAPAGSTYRVASGGVGSGDIRVSRVF